MTLGNSAEPPADLEASAVTLAVLIVTPDSCSEAAKAVKLEVIDRASAKRLERTMLISDVDAAGRPRAIAIAVSELLQTSWIELELTGSTPRILARCSSRLA